MKRTARLQNNSGLDSFDVCKGVRQMATHVGMVHPILFCGMARLPPMELLTGWTMSAYVTSLPQTKGGKSASFRGVSGIKRLGARRKWGFFVGFFFFFKSK